MRKMKGLSLMMMVVAGLLAGCNQDAPNEMDQSSQVTQENAEIIEMAETLIARLSEGEFEAATEHFNAEMLQAATPEFLEEIWETLKTQIGDFIDYEYNAVVEANGHQVVLITGVFNDSDVVFQVVFDDNHEIAAFLM